jgi:hypothetical protein
VVAFAPFRVFLKDLDPEPLLTEVLVGRTDDYAEVQAEGRGGNGEIVGGHCGSGAGVVYPGDDVNRKADPSILRVEMPDFPLRSNRSAF